MTRKRTPKEPPPPAPPVESTSPVEPQPTEAIAAPERRVIALRRRNDTAGAPYEMTEDGLAMIERLAAEGATLRQIAGILRIDRVTFRDLRRRQPEVDHALDRGNAADEHAVANVLRAQAMGGNTVAALFYLKARHGWREGQERDGASAQVNVQITMPGPQPTLEAYLATLPPNEPTGEPGE